MVAAEEDKILFPKTDLVRQHCYQVLQDRHRSSSTGHLTGSGHKRTSRTDGIFRQGGVFSTNQSCSDISSGLLRDFLAACREPAYFLFYRVQLTYAFQGFFCCCRLSAYIHVMDFSVGMGPACGFCQWPSFTFRTEQPIITCEGVRLQHTMIVTKMFWGCFPCLSGEKANHVAGGSDAPTLRSSRTYVQMHPVFVFFLPGASTGTWVSSVCSLRQSIT